MIVPGLRTRARDLSEQELVDMIHRAVAILCGAAYNMFDLAIAMAVHAEITGQRNQPRTAPTSPAELHQRQLELPRVTAEISQVWVEWAAETEGNWHWILLRCVNLQQSYERRFGAEVPFMAEFRELYRRSPRPRRPGRTPFPKEPC
jgi:hypothetical protein